MSRVEVSGDPAFVAAWNDIGRKMASQEKEWVAMLRLYGFKAAHPNDGWINRENKTLHFCYPQFNDGADVGDLVMLGWPFDPPAKWRAVKLIGRRITFLDFVEFDWEDIRISNDYISNTLRFSA